MKRLAALIAALTFAIASIVLVFATTTAPANATISFCQTAKGSPCIGPINGCALVLGGGNYGFAENGDSIINSKGEKFTCVDGAWVKQSRIASISTAISGVIGRGEVFQGAPGTDPGCNPDQVFCPPVISP